MEDPPARQQTMPPEFQIQASPLLRLPPELRNQIFQDVLAHEPRTIDPSYRLPGLLTSCRQVFGETQAMYYSQTHFHCRGEDSTVAWLARLPPVLRALIPEIRYDVCWILLQNFKAAIIRTGYHCPSLEAVGSEDHLFLRLVRRLEGRGVRLGEGVLKVNVLFTSRRDAYRQLRDRWFLEANGWSASELWTDRAGLARMVLE